MQETIDQLRILVSNNEVEKALLKLQSIFTLADSDLLNDALILSGRFVELRSNKRKGILSKEEENLTHNVILDSILSLVDEIKRDPKSFENYDIVEEKVQSDAKKKSKAILPVYLKDALFQRLSYVKQKELNIKALWIDDNPEAQEDELELLRAIGVEFDLAENSEIAYEKMKNNSYEFIISDIERDGKSNEGIVFLNKIADEGMRTPFIFFIADLDETLGTPPYCFGITNVVAGLLHYVMDVIERNH